MLEKIFRYVFWGGYFAVLLTTFIPVAGELNKIHIGPEAFHIRLDHLLHLLVYFLISMYYLFGLRMDFKLFKKYSFIRFFLLILFLGTFTEAVQLWVPDRAFNIFDLISNMVGLIIGIMIILLAQRKPKEG